MLVDAHTHRPSSELNVRILSLAELSERSGAYKNFAVGLHPWDLEKRPATIEADIRYWSQQPGCVAIGETGIDRARRIPIDLQLNWFHWHWKLAEARELPLVLHVVRASSDLLQELKRRRPQTPWQWHDFTGPAEVVKSALKLHPDLYFSFGPRGVSRPDFQTLWESVPEERRLLETDDSGFDISEVYRASGASESQILQNSRRLFALA